MYTLSRTSRGGFTLIELMIAMVIFTTMSVMVITIYLNTTHASRKLNATRHLTETARQITERLAQDVREKGINIGSGSFDDGTPDNELWKSPDYTQSGGEILAIGDGTLRYFYAKKQDDTLAHCMDSDKGDKNIHCGLYLVYGDDWAGAYNLVDSFVHEESRKRVKIQDLKFYVSGGGFTTKKVTLVMTLTLMPRIGVPASMVENTKLHIQTTISERGWKN